ncbi:unnamed protein product [Protopolystoma xenopodis]|uniref:Uncharacterized protein n=1 Tax=Protopolystoma xenopodis TaxID=117903 RepID=A0A3S4ZS89_9PLAT|nr:unnamed protein product [Protopolystoma xenopodis]
MTNSSDDVHHMMDESSARFHPNRRRRYNEMHPSSSDENWAYQSKRKYWNEEFANLGAEAELKLTDEKLYGHFRMYAGTHTQTTICIFYVHANTYTSSKEPILKRNMQLAEPLQYSLEAWSIDLTRRRRIPFDQLSSGLTGTFLLTLFPT